MRGVVVDVNVIMEAIEGKKPDDALALAEAEFMFKLFGSADHLFVNCAIVEKYRNIIKKIAERSLPRDINNTIHKVLMMTLTNNMRTNYVDGAGVDWPGIKKCDKELVGVALRSGAVLVTGDERLRKTVGDHPLGSGITCVSARDAIDMLSARG